MKPELRALSTYGHENISEVPWACHPRTQLKRENIFILNGIWDFEVPGMFSSSIRVPYPAESELSLVHRHFPEGAVLKYRRKLPEIIYTEGQSVLLHIDALDQEAEVLINGQTAARIRTFEGRDGIDITKFLSGDNEIEILVRDDLRKKEFPYGKQTLKRGGMWYTPFSGIWQSVWLETVPKEYIKGIHINVSLSEARISIDGPREGYAVFEGKQISFENGEFTLAPERPEVWSPDHPKLYDFTICAGEDTVTSYFALRTLSIETVNGIPRLCLNGRPFFFHGLLDQGYWPDGLCTPPSPECYAEDILAMKELGFNTLRKHIKIEPEQFYYECDRLGMIVFQDMVNNGTYSFFRDTILPTIGIKKLKYSRINTGDASRRMFLDSMRQTVSILSSHPSICGWTIFNEGWGQFEADRAYDILKELDSSRFIDTASGWFHPEKSDVESLHVYFRKFALPASDKPVLLSEFGGYSCKIAEHSFNLSRTYGYRFFRHLPEFMDSLEKLYLEEIVPAAERGLCGAIYTQVSDVEDETNGLLTYDRAVCKADKKRMQDIARMLNIS